MQELGRKGNYQQPSKTSVFSSYEQLSPLLLKYSRLPHRYDPLLLRQDLQPILGRDWTAHYQRKDYHGEWDIIPLRAIGGNVENVYSVPNTNRPELAYADTHLLASCSYIRSVLDDLQCEKTAVRLMRLRAGSEIKEHSDIALSIEHGEARLHIPIITDPTVEFYLDNERLSMEGGDCWYLNLSLKHRVVNRSDIDRIHLVIDCKTNEWLLDLFTADLAIVKTTDERPYEVSATTPSTREATINVKTPSMMVGSESVEIDKLDRDLVELITSFLSSIGIDIHYGPLTGATVLPGIAIEAGTLHIDLESLMYPGDLLHEAGHIAVVPLDERSSLGADTIGKRKDQAAEEMMAIAWSYAAAIHLGIDPYVVFHENGYQGGGKSIADNFKEGRTFGVSMLEYTGLAAVTRNGTTSHSEYPKMKRWIRP
jgi:hypothetical protein